LISRFAQLILSLLIPVVDIQSINFGILSEIGAQAMNLTDATKLIRRNKKNKAQTEALKRLRKKLMTHRKNLQAQVRDTERGLKRVRKHLGR